MAVTSQPYWGFVSDKGSKVRTNEHSKSCWLCYIACYVRANVCIVTGAIVWWFFFTNRSGGSLLWVKISISETVREMNINKERHVESYSGWTADGCLEGREITELGSWDRQQDLRFCVFRVLSLAFLMVRFFWDVTHYRMLRRVVLYTYSGLSVPLDCTKCVTHCILAGDVALILCDFKYFTGYCKIEIEFFEFSWRSQ